jgi:hypothetical protein
MKTYTKEEADILIRYYGPKIIGSPVTTKLSKDYKIASLEIEFVEQNKYAIYCIAEDRFTYRRRLAEFVEDYNLINPDEVLKNHNS